MGTCPASACTNISRADSRLHAWKTQHSFRTSVARRPREHRSAGTRFVDLRTAASDEASVGGLSCRLRAERRVLPVG